MKTKKGAGDSLFWESPAPRGLLRFVLFSWLLLGCAGVFRFGQSLLDKAQYEVPLS